MSSYVRRKTAGDSDWFVHDRFGMFLHFGLYAMPARHEQVKRLERMSEAEYERYFEHFNPDLFDAREWARAAKAAGMKYAVLTTKHEDGFCLFDSQYTDYKITNTAFGRDLVREFVDAFRAEGLRVGFYYSLIDWHHPQYPIDVLHPRHWDADAAQQDAGRDMKKYNEYARNQVRELLTNYGKIDVTWFDYSFGPWPQEHRPFMQFNGAKGAAEWEAEEMVRLVRSLQPHVLINNRMGLDLDFRTPEQFVPETWPRDERTGEYITWEACHTFSGSWGYHRDEASWKTPQMLLELLVDNVAMGGNLLMNVGPTARGCFDGRAMRSLQVYADWMRYNSRSIYGCTMAEPEFTAPAGTKLTQSVDGKRLYIHLQSHPFKELAFPTLDCDRIAYAQFLADGSEARYRANFDRYFGGADRERGKVNGTCFDLPVNPEFGLCPVIEVFLK